MKNGQSNVYKKHSACKVASSYKIIYDDCALYIFVHEYEYEFFMTNIKGELIRIQAVAMPVIECRECNDLNGTCHAPAISTFFYSSN
jgi:hypothetical protein